jgi:hypothetical protein
VARLFRHNVLRMLLEEGAIEEHVVRNLLAWPHTGCGTHVSREIPADGTTPGVDARYMTRPPVTPERMVGEASKTQIIYRSDAVHPRHQANFRVFDPLDFLAEVSAHVPDAHEKTTLFYGWYSNRTRGYRKRHGLLGDASPADPAADESDGTPLEVRRSWARLIRHVYEVTSIRSNTSSENCVAMWRLLSVASCRWRGGRAGEPDRIGPLLRTTDPAGPVSTLSTIGWWRFLHEKKSPTRNATSCPSRG